jgi:hypothetical protein
MTGEETRNTKNMEMLLSRIGIYRNDWAMLELENGERLYPYSPFSYRTFIITLTSGRTRRVEIKPLYRKRRR